MKSLLAALALVLVLALAGCGTSSTDTGSTSTPTSNPTSTEAGAGSQSLKIADFAYSPPNLTVDAGTTIAITNEDDSPHTVTSKQSGTFDSGTIDGGKRGKVTFPEVGTYAYFCAFHPFMNGTVTVE